MSDQLLKMYWLPNCSTCRQAVEYIEKNGHAIAELRDIKTNPLNRSEVVRLSALVGGVDQLFSRRARKYREMNLAGRELSEDEMIDLMSKEYTFIKRPVLVSNGRAVAGFSMGMYDGFLEKA